MKQRQDPSTTIIGIAQRKRHSHAHSLSALVVALENAVRA